MRACQAERLARISAVCFCVSAVLTIWFMLGVMLMIYVQSGSYDENEALRELKLFVRVINEDTNRTFGLPYAQRRALCIELGARSQLSAAEQLAWDGHVCARHRNESSCPWLAESLPQAVQTRVLLASFPGSGNSFVRLVLERVSGYLTGSTYREESLKQAGFEGEMYDSNVLVVKTHLSPRWHDNVSSAIVLVRQPMAAVASFEAFRVGGHWKGSSTSTWARFRELFLLRDCALWTRHVLEWSAHSGAEQFAFETLTNYHDEPASTMEHWQALTRRLALAHGLDADEVFAPERLSCALRLAGAMRRSSRAYRPRTLDEFCLSWQRLYVDALLGPGVALVGSKETHRLLGLLRADASQPHPQLRPFGNTDRTSKLVLVVMHKGEGAARTLRRAMDWLALGRAVAVLAPDQAGSASLHAKLHSLHACAPLFGRDWCPVFASQDSSHLYFAACGEALGLAAFLEASVRLSSMNMTAALKRAFVEYKFESTASESRNVALLQGIAAGCGPNATEAVVSSRLYSLAFARFAWPAPPYAGR